MGKDVESMSMEEQAEYLSKKYGHQIIMGVGEALNKMIEENPKTSKKAGFSVIRRLIAGACVAVIGSELEQGIGHEISQEEKTFIGTRVSETLAEIVSFIAGKQGVGVETSYSAGRE